MEIIVKWCKVPSDWLKRYACGLLSSFSHIQLFATLWTVACQAPLFMGFSKQKYWSGFAMTSPRGFSWPRDLTSFSYVSCIGRQVLYYYCLLESPTKVKWKWKWYSLGHVLLFATPWSVAHQAPLSMKFSRQEYWSGLPCPPPGDAPNWGIEPRSPTLQADSLPFELPRKLLQRYRYY